MGCVADGGAAACSPAVPTDAGRSGYGKKNGRKRGAESEEEEENRERQTGLLLLLWHTCGELVHIEVSTWATGRLKDREEEREKKTERMREREPTELSENGERYRERE